MYAKCITEEEYHSSKRPLLQRLAIQGAEIDARDVIVGSSKVNSSEEEWSVIDLKDENSLISKETSSSKNKSKQNSAMKQIKGVKSVFSFASSNKNGRNKEDFSREPILGTQKTCSFANAKNELGISQENPFWDIHMREKESDTRSILMAESLVKEPLSAQKQSGGDSLKKKPFRTLFQRQGNGGIEECEPNSEERVSKSAKKKWKKSDSDDETAPLSLSQKSDDLGIDKVHILFLDFFATRELIFTICCVVLRFFKLNLRRLLGKR